MSNPGFMVVYKTNMVPDSWRLQSSERCIFLTNRHTSMKFEIVVNVLVKRTSRCSVKKQREGYIERELQDEHAKEIEE